MKAAFFSTGCHDGPWNMAFDRLLMELVRHGRWDYVLRTYRWDPPCVSLGRHQKPEKEIDVKRLLDDGYGIVRRPTGGRAVWHERELTYSITAPQDNPMVSGSISEALRKTSRPMLLAMESLGVEVSADASERHRIPGPRTNANPCFTSHGKWEIGTADGRKLVGSAQARSRGVFLEHGSILLDNDQMKILEYLPETSSPEMKNMLRHHLSGGTACLREFLPGIDFEYVESSIRSAFQKDLGCVLEPVSCDSILGTRFDELLEETLNDI